MVRAGSRVCFCAAAAALLAPGLPARDLGSYRIGDRIESEVVTPFPLVVIDDEATAALQTVESTNVPLQMRFDTNAASESVAAFRKRFAETRSSFQQALQAAFARPALEPQEIDSPRFQRFALRFELDNPLFPAGTNLAALWARGDTNRSLQESFESRLNDVAQRPIRASDDLPPDLGSSGSARLIPVGNTNEAPTVRWADNGGTSVGLADIVSLQRAQAEAQRAFASDGPLVAEYMASLIRPNCAPDVELTRRLRTERAASFLCGQRYEAGQIVARKGQVVDGRIKAALDQLADRAAASRWQLSSDALRLKLQHANRYVRSLAVLCLALLPFAGLGLMCMIQRNRARAYSGASPALMAQQPAAGTGGPIPGGWMRRLLFPHAHSHKARQASLDGRRAAERLATIQSRIQDRLLTHERKIADLEKAVASKEALDRDLVRTELEDLRKQLELDRVSTGSA